MTIRFLKIKEPYGFCSNFYPCQVPFGGVIYPTSEHAYQAQKFVNTAPDRATQIAEVESPWAAAKLGRDRSVPIREDWDDARVQIMYSVVRAKFFCSENEDIAQKLVGTGEQVIEEHFKDKFWGNGYGNGGKNWLGRILMRVRDDIRGRWSEGCIRKHYVELLERPLGSQPVTREVSRRDPSEVAFSDDCIGYRFYDQVLSGCVAEDGSEFYMRSKRHNVSALYLRAPKGKDASFMHNDGREIVSDMYGVNEDEIEIVEVL